MKFCVELGTLNVLLPHVIDPMREVVKGRLALFNSNQSRSESIANLASWSTARIPWALCFLRTLN
jgi:hypothetical protein